MKYEIIGSVMPVVEVTFEDTRESIITQSGGMSWMDEAIKMETNMKNGNYTNAVITFINFSDKCYNEDVKSILLLIVPIAIALVIAILVAVVIYVKYKKNAFNESYPLEEFSNINYTNSKDHLINTHVSKVKIETSNSSSSRSSGGGHRGGGRF